MTATHNALGCLALALPLNIASLANADPSLPPFYEAVARMKAEGKLGEVIKKERIATPIPDAEAWRIAYVSSDMTDKNTISTGLVIAPTGRAPSDGRPIVSWAHGTTGRRRIAARPKSKTLRSP